jgi:hypothetical protein
MPTPRPAAPVSLAVLLSALAVVLPRPAFPWALNGAPLCNSGGAQTAPVVVSDGVGGVLAAWTDQRSGGADVYLTRFITTGVPATGWPVNGLAVCTAAGSQTGPVIATDGQRGAFVAWRDRRCGSGCIEIYLQRVTADGVIAPGWPANGLLVGALADSVHDGPVLVSDEARGVIVVWAHGNPLLPVLPDLRVMRIRADGSGAPGWPPSGFTFCESVFQSHPVVIGDDAGGAIIAWQHVAQNGADFDIRATRVTVDGNLAPGWPPCGVPLCDEVGDQVRPRLVSDGQGGALATWADARGGGARDIYAQRVQGDGAIATGWPAAGLAVCTDAADQHSPELVADGASGAIVAWEDDRAPLGGASDLYATRVLAAGAVDAQWPASGFGVCLAADEQTHHQMIEDLGGGAVITWEDWRQHTASDIYAVRITGAGAVYPGWATNGTALCTAAGPQRAPGLVISGVGGANVVWQDGRVASDDVYGQQVSRDGVVPVLVSLVSAHASADRVRLSWAIAFEEAAELEVQRSRGGAWVPLGPPSRDARGRVSFDDPGVIAGSRYGYRLLVRQGGSEWAAGEVWLDVPRAHRLALDAVRPNPAFRAATVSFSLASQEPATLEVVDLAGRRVVARRLSLGPGSHAIPLDLEPAPGIYFMRLTQGGESRTCRVAFAR